jgi:hypothetical protein
MALPAMPVMLVPAFENRPASQGAEVSSEACRSAFFGIEKLLQFGVQLPKRSNGGSVIQDRAGLTIGWAFAVKFFEDEIDIVWGNFAFVEGLISFANIVPVLAALQLDHLCRRVPGGFHGSQDA